MKFGGTIPPFFSPGPGIRGKLHTRGIFGSREANGGASVKVDHLAFSNRRWFQNQGAGTFRQPGTACSGLNEGGRGLAMGANCDRRVLVGNSRGLARKTQLRRSTSSRDLPLESAWSARVLPCCSFATKVDWTDQELLRIQLGIGLTDDDFVFIRHEGSPINPNAVTHAFQRVIKKAGLKHVRLHDLRHTHAYAHDEGGRAS